jgi:hypothetical protein
MHRLATASIVVLAGISILSGWSYGADGPKSKVEYARDVRPLLADHCFACHGGDDKARKGRLRLDRREDAVRGGRSGKPAIIAGKPDASELLRRIHASDPAERMPPANKGKELTSDEKALLRRWIEQGAEYQAHWALLPPKRPALPHVKNAAWLRNGIDAFVLARLEAEGLTPSPEADRATLVRRVTLDLTGLPPTPAEVDAARADTSPAWFEKVVDRLLASPHYGERMALPWLDLARYADTNGYNNDEERTMWGWRDWVIDAFNDNLPFDRFIVDQIAGDLLPGATQQQILATGFNRNHVFTTEGGIIPEEYRVEYVVDRVHTTATALLGLSLQCARCHEHKYDPISQTEYYRFFAYFNSQPDQQGSYNAAGVLPPAVKLPSRWQRAEVQILEARRLDLEHRRQQRAAAAEPAFRDWLRHVKSPMKEIAEILAISEPKRTAQQQERLRKHYLETIDPVYRLLESEYLALLKQQAALERTIPQTMVMQELPQPRPTHLLKRGRYDQPGEKVSPGVPACLPPLPEGSPPNRLGLARWLVARGHPLTARVAVNRWWEMYFGTGIVETVEDFGLQGALPSHPELLDWLATELIRTGWDVKAMQRAIVTSATYRQSSRVTPALLERDPHNRLLARGTRLRLPAEMLRDNALAIAGLLSHRIGGPSVRPYQPDGLWQDVSVERRAVYKAGTGEDLYRRSLYTFWKRTCPPPTMAALDAPDRETCVVRRARTNTPLHALILLNDPTYIEASRKLAERLLQEGGDSAEARLRHAFCLAVARPSRPAEEQVLLPIYRKALDRFRGDRTAAEKLLAVGASARDARLDAAELAAWTTIASLVLNLDETMTKE